MKFFTSLLLACIFVTSVYAEDVLDCPLTTADHSSFLDYWHQSATISSEREKIVDWLPQGKSAEDSEESFTIQAYQFDDDFDLKWMYEKFITTLEENIEPSDSLHYKVHSKNRKSIFFEWWVNSPNEHAQHEWIKLLKNKNDQLAIVRFVTKQEVKTDVDEQWIRCVESTDFCPQRKKGVFDAKLKEACIF